MAEFENVRLFEGKKFLWDGASREKKADAEEAAKKYAADGFETRIVEKDGAYGVYTRRVVTEVVVEGQP